MKRYGEVGPDHDHDRTMIYPYPHIDRNYKDRSDVSDHDAMAILMAGYKLGAIRSVTSDLSSFTTKGIDTEAEV